MKFAISSLFLVALAAHPGRAAVIDNGPNGFTVSVERMPGTDGADARRAL